MYNILYFGNEDTTLLKSDHGYEILNVSDTKNLFHILEKSSVDVLVLDKEDSFVIAEKLRADQHIDQSMHIIFLTTDNSIETVHKVFQYGDDFLVKPFGEYELLERLQYHIDNVKKFKKCEKDIIFNQSVLDSQSNIIFIQDDNGLVNVNKSFLKFFNVSSISEFETLYGNVADLFMEYENYFSLNILNNTKKWYSQISEKKISNYDILLMNYVTFEPESFMIDVNIIPYSDKYVVTLTNITELTTKSKKLEHQANYDNLTQIYNRNKFNEILELHYDLFKRYNDDLCFAIFDIDFFKKVNDEYGHNVGDDTLITFSKTIHQNIRNTDIFARWGGEEFTLLMPKTKLEDAYNVVENLRKIIEKVDFKTIGHKTCSIGVTQFKDRDTIESVTKRADDALYEAKENGRNKVYKK